VIAYAATLLLMAVLYTIWWRYARTRRRLIAPSVSEGELRAIDRGFAPGLPLYTVVFALAFFSPLAAVILNPRARRLLLTLGDAEAFTEPVALPSTASTDLPSSGLAAISVQPVETGSTTLKRTRSR
jgi:hypothetical protein